VHGSDRCFRKFLAAAESYDADALVLGGDIAGKGLVPISSDNGMLTAKVRGEMVTVPRAEEDRLRAEINRQGFYSILTDARDIERMENDSAYLDTAFKGAIIEQIKELIETRVRPAVAQDGGDIAYKGYREGHLYLTMHGACSGCPSSTVTLKRGIESLIRHYVPEVESVEAV